MQFPESWLRSLCNPPLSTAELADTLTMAGLEVEGLEPVAPPFSEVVVAQVLAVHPHPNADRLKVCTVDDGRGTPLQIVCGAPNVAAGLKVPCARAGAILPPAEEGGEPLRIRTGKLRGVESAGMLCSARELKLAADDAGLMVLAPQAPVGQSLREHLRLDDTLFTLKLTPNLAHCLSVHGVARELAALTGASLHPPSIAAVPPSSTERRPVHLEAPELCGRFSGRVIRGLNPRARTPDWVAERLLRCGQRLVSPLVDLSNYLMFELGRPSHVFDLARLQGDLSVRWGRAGETLQLLNGQTVDLGPDEAGQAVGVIADARGPVSLAGLMGGAASAVGDATTDVYVECAFWWPQAVAGRARRHRFSTEAGHRFERGVDAAHTARDLERLTALILDVCGTPETQVGPVDDQITGLPARPPVSLRLARAERVIGMPIAVEQAVEVFTRLGLAPTVDTTGGEGGVRLRVLPPSWRFDLQIEEDLIEELIRVIGYPQLPATPPRAPVTARVASEARRGLRELRHATAALGYQETVNYSFVEARWEHELAGNPSPLRVLNPIASPLAVMRSSLLGSLIAVLRHNLARKAGRVRVFEIGRVFLRDPSVPDSDDTVAGVNQPLRLAGLAYGPADAPQWGLRERPVDFYDAKGDVEALLAPRSARFVADVHPALHPGRSARIELDGQAVGWLGELHPRWRQAYELPAAPLLFELDLEALRQRPLPQQQPLPKRLPVQRDLALIAPDAVDHDRLIEALRAGPHAGLLREARLFDVYRPATPSADLGAGERSLAVRLELLDDAESLTDARIDATLQDLVRHLEQTLAVRLRR